jgi:hypothetical protein
MQHTQQRMKKYVDLKCSERKFELGQQVYLRLQPYPQTSVASCHTLKLSSGFNGPFSVICKVGEVAYLLDLPPEARIHPIFHVSQLKPKFGSASSALPKLPLVDSNRVLLPQPVEVLDRHSRPKNNCPFIELLIHWEG